MKYVITESRLEETITNYFDEIFDIDNIHYVNPLEYDDETGEEWDDDKLFAKFDVSQELQDYIRDFLPDFHGIRK